MIEIKSTFKIAKEARMTKDNTKEKDKENTIYDIVDGINQLALKNEVIQSKERKLVYADKNDFLSYVVNVMKGLVVKDTEDGVFYLRDILYKPYRIEDISFIYGNIVNIEQYKGNDKYILVDYFDRGNIYKACLVSSNRNYKYAIRDYVPEEGMILAGFLYRKKYQIMGKKSYNARTHTSYAGPQKEKYKNVLLHYAILPITDQGIYYRSEMQKREICDLVQNGAKFTFCDKGQKVRCQN